MPCDSSLLFRDILAFRCIRVRKAYDHRTETVCANFGSHTVEAQRHSGSTTVHTSLPAWRKEDMTNNLNRTASDRSDPVRTKTKARAILAGLNTGKRLEQYQASMKELARLAEACSLEVVSCIVQNAPKVTQKTYLGSGKVEQLRREIDICDADIVIFNEALTPMQVRNLEDTLDTEIMDRTGIILEIFRTRARTKEAKLQVESARLAYILPRLAGMRQNLSRQGGGSGRLSNKGAGEEKLELDRRHIQHQLTTIDRQLEKIEKERNTQRSRRLSSGLPLVALVGYTNAGKSTLMNGLLERCRQTVSGAPASKKVLEKDMLFATLDTSVRRIQVPGSPAFLLSDTVGFISELPHTLVKAFRSTLDEVHYARLLLEVVDYSDPDYEKEIQVTRHTLEEIGAGDIPILIVYNKCDLVAESNKAIAAKPEIAIPARSEEEHGTDHLYMSAAKGIGYDQLLRMIRDNLKCCN